MQPCNMSLMLQLEELLPPLAPTAEKLIERLDVTSHDIVISESGLPSRQVLRSHVDVHCTASFTAGQEQ